MPKVLDIEITEENYQRAIAENSGGCLVADAIKTAYPELSDVRVDVATIRASDRKAGERYIWVTPQSVADTLLWFDQGWKEKQFPKKLRIRFLARILPIRSRPSQDRRRAERKADLEAKEQRGEKLTADENRALQQMRSRENKSRPQRPSSTGPLTIENIGDDIVMRGGRHPNIGKKHPNLLAGKNRHFGEAKAIPGIAFKEALDKAVAEAVEKDRRQRAI